MVLHRKVNAFKDKVKSKENMIPSCISLVFVVKDYSLCNTIHFFL